SGPLSDTIATASCWRRKRPVASRNRWSRPCSASTPVRKRVPRRFPASLQQLRDSPAPPDECLENVLKFRLVILHPLRRQLAQCLVEHFRREVPDPLDPRLEVTDRPDSLVQDSSRIQPGHGRVRDIPVRTVEGESVIDHQGHTSELSRRHTRPGQPIFQLRAEKDRLPPVRVGNPAVKGQHRKELLGVCNLAEQGVRNEIVNSGALRIARMPRSKMPARFDRNAARACLQMDLGTGREKVARKTDDLVRWRRNLQVREDFTGHPFVDQNPAVLRVILEFDDVTAAVVRFKQMRLRAAPHLPDEPASIHRHRICRNPECTIRRDFTMREDITGWQKNRKPPEPAHLTLRKTPRRKTARTVAMKWLWN